MSATLMGAVMSCGPKKGSVRFALAAIADNSDDYGFACPSIETIAEKVCCDPRTAMRLVQTLESAGWMKVSRKVLSGKGSVYFIDIAKLGVTVNPKMRRSPLHVEVVKQLAGKPARVSPRAAVSKNGTKHPEDGTNDSGDILSPESKEKDDASFFAPEKSGDNSQGVQVTKTPESGDKNAVAILKNRCEPLLNPNNPQPPSKSKGASFETEGENAAKRSGAERSSGDATTRNLVCEESVAKVMRECSLSNPRMERVIRRAMATERARMQGKQAFDCNATAELMVANFNQFCQHTHLMRHSLGTRTFFAENYWRNDSRWPYDEKKLS